MRRSLTIALAAAVVACGANERPESRAERALAARLTGTWDAAFTLDRAALGRALGDGAGARPTARGTLALLPSDHGAGNASLPRPVTHSGAYTIDFRGFGFDPRAPGPVPTLQATIIAPDTLVAVLPVGDDDEGALVLRGALGGDSVAGTWSYGGRAAGGWGGTFVLRRHRTDGR